MELAGSQAPRAALEALPSPEEPPATDTEAMQPPEPAEEAALTQAEAVAPDFEQFVRLFLAGKAECGSWFDHNLAWYTASRADPSRVLFLQYETMFADPTAAVRRIAAFVGLDDHDDALDDREAAVPSLDLVAHVDSPEKFPCATTRAFSVFSVDLF